MSLPEKRQRLVKGTPLETSACFWRGEERPSAQSNSRESNVPVNDPDHECELGRAVRGADVLPQLEPTNYLTNKSLKGLTQRRYFRKHCDKNEYLFQQLTLQKMHLIIL